MPETERIFANAIPAAGVNLAMGRKMIEALTPRPWTWREHAIYNIGHNDGESCRQADWSFALTEWCELPEGVDEYNAFQVAEYIASLQK